MISIRKIIKCLLPYGVVRIRRRWIESYAPQPTTYISPINQFMQDFREYIHGDQKVQYDKASKFRYIVSVKGYGRTGSSAIVDLLREYSSVFVLGHVDPYYSKAIKDKLTDEVAYMRDAGGFAEIERFIGTTNRFQHDALLHRFILLITSRSIYRECPAVRPYFYQFFADITKVQKPIPDTRYYNKHLDYYGNKDIFLLKDMSKEKYRQIVKSLLNSIFNTFHSPGKEILVLDQFLLDCDYSESELKEIIPNIKTIESIRDPRDVFSFINKTNVMWIPHDTPERFIEWYKDRNIVINNENETKKIIRFEELFEKYENIVSEIEGFLDINANQHTEKYRCFDPEYSRQGLMSWKNDEDKVQEYSLIEKELSYLCYK